MQVVPSTIIGARKPSRTFPDYGRTMSAVIDNYHNIQQDILETFIDSG